MSTQPSLFSDVGVGGFLEVEEYISCGATTHSTTLSQNGTTITGTGGDFITAMVGGIVKYNDGAVAFITGFVSVNELTTANSLTEASQTVDILYGGFQATGTGLSTNNFITTTLDVVENLIVGNDATIDHDLTVNNSAQINNSLVVTNSIECASATVGAGGMTIDGGNLALTTGNLTLSAGNLDVPTGTLTVGGNTQLGATKVASIDITTLDTSGKGSLLTSDGTVTTTLAPGSKGYVPYYDSSQASGINTGDWPSYVQSFANVGSGFVPNPIGSGVSLFIRQLGPFVFGFININPGTNMVNSSGNPSTFTFSTTALPSAFLPVADFRVPAQVTLNGAAQTMILGFQSQGGQLQVGLGAPSDASPYTTSYANNTTVTFPGACPFCYSTLAL
jgi:hypothetical protein